MLGLHRAAAAVDVAAEGAADDDDGDDVDAAAVGDVAAAEGAIAGNTVAAVCEKANLHCWDEEAGQALLPLHTCDALAAAAALAARTVKRDLAMNEYCRYAADAAVAAD